MSWPDDPDRIKALQRAVMILVLAVKTGDRQVMIEGLAGDPEAMTETAEAVGQTDRLADLIAEQKRERLAVVPDASFPVNLTDDTEHLDGTPRGI